MKKKLFISAGVLAGIASAMTFMPLLSNISAQSAENNVEISLSDKLDGVTSEYCLDIAGGNKNIDITKGLQAHTCYSYRGSLGDDQAFDTAKFADNKLYMPVYDVCATLEGLTSGSKVGLATCEDGNELQTLTYSGDGKISPVAASDMCFTAAKDTRFGRSKTHQIKKLSLEACSDDMAAYQTWFARKGAE